MKGTKQERTGKVEEPKKKSGFGVGSARWEKEREVEESGKVLRGRKGSWHSHIQPPSRAQEVAIGGESFGVTVIVVNVSKNTSHVTSRGDFSLNICISVSAFYWKVHSQLLSFPCTTLKQQSFISFLHFLVLIYKLHIFSQIQTNMNG